MSVHGSEGTTEITTLISFSSRSLVPCPCLPLVKSARRLRVSKPMDIVQENQPPRTQSRVEKGGERWELGVGVGEEQREDI